MSLEFKRSFARVLEKTKPLELTRGFEETKNSRKTTCKLFRRNSILYVTYSNLNIDLREFLVQQQKYRRLFYA